MWITAAPSQLHRLCTGIALLAALTGCDQPTPQSRLDDYLARLARPLELHKPDVAPLEVQPLTRAEALQIPLAPGSLDGLDFLRLRGCAIQATIAKRNSSLGRVAPPSQRLLIELAFLREADACIALMEARGTTDLVQLLRDSQARKRRQLPALIFNATLGGPEYREFWRARQASSDYPKDTSSLVVTALERITRSSERWLAGDYTADEAAFELALSEIAKADGGELLLALRTQARYLGTASSLINARVAPLCAPGRRPEAAPILRTVVTRFFLGEIQPHAALLNQRYHALLTPIRALEDRVGIALPSTYESWRAARNRMFTEALQAPKAHVRALQNLLGSCYSEFIREPAANAS